MLCVTRDCYGFNQGVLTQSQRIDNESEVYETQEKRVHLVRPGEDPPERFQPAEQPLNLVAVPVQLPVILPEVKPGSASGAPRE